MRGDDGGWDRVKDSSANDGTWRWDGACVFVRRYLGVMFRVEANPANSKNEIEASDLARVNF